jgi:hypothetical protein
MRLCESPEFRDAIVIAKDYFNRPGLTEQFIEKDYYVTEALRIIATRWQNNIVFKGGTSLSKGWNLIERFSEDLDLFLNRDTYQPKLSKNQVTKDTPVDLSFANSQALFPTGELRTLIIKEYQQQCRDLCYGSYPAWQEVADTFEQMRHKL